MCFFFEGDTGVPGAQGPPGISPTLKPTQMVSNISKSHSLFVEEMRYVCNTRLAKCPTLEAHVLVDMHNLREMSWNFVTFKIRKKILLSDGEIKTFCVFIFSMLNQLIS